MTATVTAKIDPELRDRLDAIAGTAGRSGAIAEAIEQYVGVPTPEPDPHPLQAEVDGIQPQIDKLNDEISQLQTAIRAVDFKLSQPAEIRGINAEGVWGQLEQRVSQLELEQQRSEVHRQLRLEREAAGMSIGEKRQAIAKLQEHRSRLERAITVDAAIEQIDAKALEYKALAERLNAVGAELNELGENYNYLVTEHFRDGRLYNHTRWEIRAKTLAVELHANSAGHVYLVASALHNR